MKSQFIINNYNRFINLIWAILCIVFFLQYLPGASTLEAFCLAASIIAVAYPFGTYLSTVLLRRAMSLGKFHSFILQFIGVSGIISFIICIVFRIFIYLEGKGIFPPSDIFAGRESFLFDFFVAFLLSVFINFGFCGLRFFEENLKYRNELANTQLHTLQEQINPHFMFNVLNHIYMLMQKDVESASSLLLQYSDILRYQLYSGKQEHIPIEQEVKFLQNFIAIEKNRWKNQITVECNWVIDNQEKKIPPLLFITFIENAFKHVERTVNITGYVNVDLKQNGDIIHLTVQNSKCVQPSRKREKREDSGLGLKNVKKRLDILYPQKHKLHIVNVDDFYKIELLINIAMKSNNKKLRCLIVDDELGAAEGLATYVLKLGFLELADICLSAIEAAEVLKYQKIDLMFLDINMPHLSGIEFLESLDNAPLTIFTTAYSEYALDGFRLDVIDYLLKPIGFQRFFKAVSKAQQAITAKIIIDNNSIEDFSNIYIRQLDSFKRVDWRNILYAEAMQNYVKLNFQDELLVIHQTMNSLEEMLPADTFFRIHRSYLININHITSVSGGRVFIDNKELPIAESRKNDLLDSVIYKNLISK